MLFYYYIYLCVALITLFILLRFLIARKKDVSVDFFVIAQKSENSGYFEEAIVTYEKALEEAKKRRYHTFLKNKIIEKLKTLHTVIEYNNNVLYVRQK